MRHAYPVDITIDEGGRYLAVFPDLHGGATDGATREEALAEAADCLNVTVAGMLLEGREFPPPSPAQGRPVLSVEPTLAAKVALYGRMRETGISNVELARRLGLSETVVRRMLDPRHKTKTEKLIQALLALGVRLEVHSYSEHAA